ncbi:MAG: DnaJ domain-containing protein, partial [Candidatus Rokubacteria bacterium]|nr:DnaJ domain-containing protein [Candidatus Rokubacteria bacterium]
YAVLGIAATAAPREIRQAYRRLARQYSPDVNFWEQSARGLFDEIAEAYRVLSDPEARAMYDRFGHRVGAAALEAGRRGEDVHLAVDLQFGDAARGVTLRLGVPRFSSCPDCRATGRAPAGACPACRGRGVRRGVEAVEVPIPAGVDSGDQVRLRGEGSAGPFGGPRGDLVVSTRVPEHPFFKRKGDLVHCEVPISVWEALRGARAAVPTPFGETTLVVPPGTASGQTFRLRGHGLPRPASGGGRGDLIVTVRVTVPSGLDARTEELVRELERLAPLTPRDGLTRWAGGAA